MALTNPQETIDERPSCCAYAAGRAFYGSKNNIYYSQVMEGESIDKLSRCYQQNDPTSEQISDLLATDGGSLQIDNATNIIQITKFGKGVLAYSTNGVWYLRGPETGFTATNFTLDLISEAGCVSPESVVSVGDVQYYWSNEGIYVISLNEFDKAESNNVVEDVLQSFYNTIPVVSKSKVSGSYNRIKKQVEWFYSDSTQEDAEDYKYAADKSLVLDTKSGGMWPQQYNTNLTEAEGQFIAGSVNTKQGTEDNDVVLIVIDLGTPSGTQTYNIDFGTKTDLTFKDFGSNYPTAYIETGYETLDKPSNKKVTPYVTTHFLQTEENWINDGFGGLILDSPSGCQMRAKWDWNDSNSNGRWGPAQEVYRFSRLYVPDSVGAFDSGETVVTTKNKILGRGKALSLRFEQEPNKDMQLSGYTAQFSVKGRM